MNENKHRILAHVKVLQTLIDTINSDICDLNDILKSQALEDVLFFVDESRSVSEQIEKLIGE